MAGVPAGVTLNPANHAKAQAAALMMSVNRQLSHTPSTSWTFYSTDGAAAAAASNLCLRWDIDAGAIETGCIAGFIADRGAANAGAAHRQRMLDPRLLSVSTGDVPRSGDAATGSPAAHALWPNSSAGPRPATREAFVAWPPQGFVPHQVISKRWSFSYPGANFAGASVTMSSAGTPVPVEITAAPSGGAEPTLVWLAEDAVPIEPPPADLPITVTISNVIVGGSAQSFTYTTKVIDPFSGSAPPCTSAAATPTSLVSDSVGGTYSFGLSVSPSGCAWSASSGQSWITVNSPSSGAGNGSFGITVAANPDTVGRSGVVTIAGQSIPVTQQANLGQPCSSLTMSPPSFSFGAGSGTGTSTITAPSSTCTWNTTSNDSWITVTSASSQQGNGSVSFQVASNAGGSSRTGSITAGPQTLTISQAAGSASCSSVTFNPGTISAPAAGQAATVNVNAPSGTCTWSASSGASWIAITSGTSGAGNGQLVLALAANASTSSRAGNVIVNGSSLPVSQTGQAAIGDPAVHWDFSDSGLAGGQLLADSSGSGTHGTTQGFGTVPVPGVVGTGRLFNGASDMAFFRAGAASLPNGDFTLRTWVRVRHWPGSYGIIFSTVGHATFDFRGSYLAVTANGHVVFMAADQVNTRAPWIVSHEPLQLEKWHYIAVSYSAATNIVKMYVDGDFDHAAQLTGYTPSPIADLDIGRAGWYDGAYLDHAIDELAVFPGVFSDAQIQGDYGQFSAPAAMVNTNTSLELKLDGNALDNSGNSNHGTAIEGSVPTTGVSGGAWQFDGFGGRIEIPANDSFTPTLATTRFWIKLDSYPGNFAVMASSFGSQVNGWAYSVYQDGRVILSPASYAVSNPWILSTQSLQLGRWYHLAITFDARARRMKLYIDGVLDTNTWIPGVTAQADGILSLGGASWYQGAYLSGSIDEFRIDKRIWTPAEILQDSQGTSVPISQAPSRVVTDD